MSEEMKNRDQAAAAGRVGCERIHEVIPSEAAGEYVLPDYQPEIRKILSVNASVSPSGQYIGADRAEFTGRVIHRILYTTEDGSLQALSLPTDYSFSLPLSVDSPACVTADSVVEGSTCRLGGPRKLSLRTRLRNTVRVMEEEVVAPELRGMGSAADAAALETLTGEIDSCSMQTADTGEFMLADTVRLENVGEGTRVVRNCGNVLISECRVREDGCFLRGDAWVSVLLCDSGAPYSVQAKLPFEQLIPFTSLPSGAVAVAYGRVNAVEATLTPDGEGEGGTLSLEISAEAEATVYLPMTAHPTLALYSTAYETETSLRTLTATRLLGTGMGNYTVSGGRPKSECEAENALTVAATDGRVEVTTVTAEQGRVTVSGTVHAALIFSGTPEGEGASPLLCAEITVPFRVQSEVRVRETAHPRYLCHAELIAVRGRIEPSTLACDCEIALTVSAMEECEHRVLASAAPSGEERLPCGGDLIRVVYPREEDTLFSIAARYHCARATLAAQNGLGEEALAASHLPSSLDGVHHLIVG